MTATLSVARDDILTTFKAAWDADPTTASIPVQYQNVKSDIDATADATTEAPPWARVVVNHVNGFQATLSNGAGNRRYRRNGLLAVSCFAPAGDGSALSDAMVQVATDAFEGVTTTNGVIFRNVRQGGPGIVDGPWFMVNVLANFEYDEVK